ncbi:hypothetical protein L6452_37345 [Arctium lappa]|uniref:Uncharacterized protein n=1 Tax=Arctium lappa TaxID=4217 RepID=A0ACB8Y2R3_ARCLA|nr:hypothetical protein L6452_37345 [Arctium lappa]
MPKVSNKKEGLGMLSVPKSSSTLSKGLTLRISVLSSRELTLVYGKGELETLWGLGAETMSPNLKLKLGGEKGDG